ncbi:hypothetical protein ACTFIW_003098 [Dictyostelium discoideum]
MNNLIRRSLLNQINLNRAGQKFRESIGLTRSGNQDGPLHDLPDFHFANGEFPALTDTQKKWMKTRINEAKILNNIVNDVETQRSKVIGAIKTLEQKTNKSIQNKKQKKVQKDTLFEKKNE